MKKLFSLPALIAVTLFCSCQKQQTEAERNAEIERQVQQRLDAERQTQEQQQLSQRVTDLEAQRKAAADANNTVATQQLAEAPAPERDRSSSSAPRTRAGSDRDGRAGTANYSTFYNKLEPHGAWRETSTYGYVWQPREAQSRSWRPYTNGHWVYTDAGWTWMSDEPFGWATYHYGRWTRLRDIGWVWVPGDEWAPAWVSWRKSNDYVGWAPLPPEARFERNSGIHSWADNYYDIGPEQYAFVPTNEFGEQRVERSVVPAERNVTIVNETTNVTNITYNNTTIINQGPSYDEMRTRTRQPIERLRLERQVNVNINLDNPRAVVRGEVVEMPAPIIARTQVVERPRSLKEAVIQAVVEHGWEKVDRQAADKMRVKMRREATPPPNAPSKTFVKPAEASAGNATSAQTSTSLGSNATTPPAPATATPAPTAIPHDSAPAAASATPASTVAESSTPVRHQMPKKFAPGGTPSTVPAMSVSPSPSAPSSPHLPVAPSATSTPPPTASVTPAASEPPQAGRPRPRGRFESQARKFEGPKTVPMNSPSPSASPAPETATSPASPNVSSSQSPPTAFGGPADRKGQRKAAKELRKQDRMNVQPGGAPQSAPSPVTESSPAAATAAASPSATASPFMSRKQQKKENRQQRRAGRQEGQADETSSSTPTPTATPQ